jgi:hypothetical protein
MRTPASPDPRGNPPDPPIQACEGIGGRALTERRSVTVNDYQTWEYALASLKARGPMSLTTELRVKHGDGAWRDFEVILNNQLADPAVAGIVATYHDVTERKSFESDLRYMALHDPLLDLPNRVPFMERLEQALVECEQRGLAVGVLFIDAAICTLRAA